jgi:hypothetical protein
MKFFALLNADPHTECGSATLVEKLRKFIFGTGSAGCSLLKGENYSVTWRPFNQFFSPSFMTTNPDPVLRKKT